MNTGGGARPQKDLKICTKRRNFGKNKRSDGLSRLAIKRQTAAVGIEDRPMEHPAPTIRGQEGRRGVVGKIDNKLIIPGVHSLKALRAQTVGGRAHLLQNLEGFPGHKAERLEARGRGG